jgi:putative ABC transport system permease protein
MSSRRIETLLRNVRYALRSLARTPGFTITIVLTLALGIGANSAVFSAIDAILLRPLPFADSDRLVRLTEIRDGSGETGVALARLLDWNRLSASFEGISGYSLGTASLTTVDVPEKLVFAMVAPRFLEVLGAAPAIGRGFIDEEHRIGQSTAVLYSDRFWHTQLGADPNVLGTTIGVEGQSLSIVGVMPASFRFLDRDVDSWSSVQVDAPWLLGRGTGDSYRVALGRLKPGVTLEQARADLAVVQAQLGELYPDTDREVGIGIAPLKDTVVGGARGSLWLLFGAVSVLLLIACTNIAALLLSRATKREHEIAIRYSLGASRAAVVVQLLVEVGVLAFAGAAVGVVVATAIAAALGALAPDLPRLDEVAIDARILLYTLVCVVFVTVLCGLIPALRNARGGATLSSSGRTQVSPRHSLQWSLVGVQVALCVTLLAGAGLLVRSFDALSRVETGFDPARVLGFRIVRNSIEWSDYDRVRQRINRMLDEIGALPGVDAAASSAYLLPGVPNDNQGEFQLVEGRADTQVRLIADGRFVSPSFFETLRIPVLTGELCRRPASNAERSSAGEAMVNRSFVARYFPGRSVIGLNLQGAGSAPVRITGIVGDARERGIDRAPGPTVYTCDSALTPFGWFLVRTAGEPLAVAGAVRTKINELEPLDAVYDVAPLEERIDGAYAQNRLRMVLLTLFAGAALSLACLGLYGTLSYVVSLRRREIGLRVALGALSSNIVSQFLLKALRVVGIACAAGLVLSFAFTRVLSGMLYGVSPSDPITLSAVIVIVTAVAALAALFPALRASRVDPMQVLREE